MLVLGWLAIWGHSVEPIILRVLNVQSRGICARLQRAGYTRRIAVPMSQVAVWALTAAGLRAAELALQRPVAYLSHPERLTLSRLTHDLAVQEEALAWLPVDLPGLGRMRADRELRSWSAAIRPDLLVRTVNESGEASVLCIELEESVKGSRELRAKLLAILPVLRPRLTFLWLLKSQASANRYARIWSEVVEAEGDGLKLTKEELLGLCVFKLRVTAGRGA